MRGERCERQARSDAPSVHTEERIDFTVSQDQDPTSVQDQDPTMLSPVSRIPCPSVRVAAMLSFEATAAIRPRPGAINRRYSSLP